MAKVNLVEKKVQMGLGRLIKFQLLAHCYVHDIPINESDLNCLTLLGTLGAADLSDFCVLVSSKNIFKTTQTVRNCLVKMEKTGIITKDGPSKKRIISLNPDIKIQISGNILLNYKFFYIGTQES